MSDITTMLTASVTLISAFSTSSPVHNGLCLYIYDIVVLPVAFYFMIDRNMVNLLKLPSLLPLCDMVLFSYSVQ